jgi:hypothetical protein
MNKKIICIFTTLLLSFTHYAFAVTNGELDEDNHPYVGLLIFDVDGGPAWRCSGTLLSPTVMLTAGHCTDGATGGRVWFCIQGWIRRRYPRFPLVATVSRFTRKGSCGRQPH